MPGLSIQVSAFSYQDHPLSERVSTEVDNYFLEHWPFPDTRSRRRFLGAGFSKVTCLYFPLSKDDRIHFACRLLTLLFLIDDLLEDMSFEEGAAYNERLMPLARGTALPDRSIPVEYIMYDLWESMRQQDLEMANDILEPTFEFMRAQTDKTRATDMGLAEYFEYRERDVGRGLLSALMRFCMCLPLSKEEAELAREVDLNCSRHLSAVNDVWSYDKELLAAKVGHEEGGVLCSSVSIVMQEAAIPAAAAKRVLYGLCREWEVRHGELVAKALQTCNTPNLRAYFRGLELQMSGNEVWSRSTPRYRTG
ncbi:Aristolochene synthase in complex with 12,13 Difluorofarnesyl diphosphate [Xylariales sp. PMI_506]|nr:Aristolochene synthase in complex with 12,13 Difluorofarnesyl diphosphate [Xylariales sp. PMI_506]